MRFRRLLPWDRAVRDRELDEEVEAHLRMAAADRIASGEPPEAAAANARREFGNVGLVKEVTREMWGGIRLEPFVQDLRFGFRTLAKSPGFLALAILCLAVGIGANAAVYGWIEGILLRPYPLVTQQDRWVVVAGTSRGEPGTSALSWPEFTDLRRSASLLDSFVTDKITGATLGIGERSENAVGQIVSSNYFDAIGVSPVLGRGFESDEETGRNAHPVIVISHRMWRDRFNSDPGILGRTQRLNGVPHTIVGVAPEGFVGTFVGYAMQFWVPASMQEKFDLGGYKLEDRGARWVEGMARLAPGVTREQAQAELSSLAGQMEAAFPATNKGRGIELFPVWRSPFNGAGELFPTLRIALVVALLVLLIACANVGNLLLARGLARRQELTVRLAVGSGRGRLVRQLLTEGLILSTLAAAGGLLFAYWGRNLLVLVLPPRSVPLNLPASFDWRVLALSAGACLVATLLFALMPAIQSSDIDLAGAMRLESGGVVGAGGPKRFRSGLVLLQVSLSFTLIVAAGLLIRSVRMMRTADPGFRTEEVLISLIDLDSAGYDGQRGKIFQDELIDRVQAIEGVQSAAYARITPFSYPSYSSSPIVVEGYQPSPDEQPAVEYDEVSPSYFATMGIPLLAGRDLNRNDDESTPPVAVVNEAMAARYWPRSSPLGRFIDLKGQRVEVVGVAAMSKYESLQEPARPFFYVPLRQHPAGVVILCVRTSMARAALAPALARGARSLDPGVDPTTLSSMREQVDRRSAAQTVALSLVGSFGGLALLLAAVGLYGVTSYSVSQRTRELGLRMALGAEPIDLLRLAMSSGLCLVAGGAALGAVAALGTAPLLGDLLYKENPRDPIVFASALVVLTIATLGACFLPAVRAARTDPVRALRE